MKIERICDTQPFENGADPMWSYGNSTILRIGEDVFATNMRVIEGRAPNNRVCLEIYARRGGGAWRREYSEEGIFQREPCPILYLGDGRFAVSVNYTDEVLPAQQAMHMAPCTPKVRIFRASPTVVCIGERVLCWDEADYRFCDHSYRGFALDRERGHIFFANQYLIPDSGAHCWALTDPEMNTLCAGKLDFPERACYHNIAVRGGEAYLFAIRDIHEPVKAWEEFKYALTGNRWDYDFRVLHMSYSPDILREPFGEAVVVAERDATCGRMVNCDCAWDANGDMLFVYAARRVWHDEMRERFFPEAPADETLELVRIRAGQVVSRRVIDRSCGANGRNPDTVYGAALHTMHDGSVVLLWSKSGAPDTDEVGSGLYLGDVQGTRRVRVALDGAQDIGRFFISRERLGAAPCDRADLFFCGGGALWYLELDAARLLS